LHARYAEQAAGVTLKTVELLVLVMRFESTNQAQEEFYNEDIVDSYLHEVLVVLKRQPCSSRSSSNWQQRGHTTRNTTMRAQA
jgi:hypothetical protein